MKNDEDVLALTHETMEEKQIRTVEKEPENPAQISLSQEADEI
jgi:hypothetical protein